MTTYYYGIVEFGDFVIGEDRYPLAIIHRVDVVKEFDTPAQAWNYYINANGEHESYVSLDSKDELGVQYTLAFKQHR